MNKANWKEKVAELKQRMHAQVSRLIQMCKENKKVMFILGAFLIVFLGVFSIITFSEKKEEAVVQAELETANQENEIVVPQEALEKDAYPEVNNLVKQYFQALVEGDIDTIKSIKNYTDAEEELKIVKKSEFIEGYPVLTVHTKKGPEENSYVAYVQYEVKFVDQEVTAPGLSTLYICTDENGKLYINANELEESVVEYLKTISVQNDVVDLFNTVQVAFNDVKMQNEELSVFLDELPNLLAEAVNEAMEEQKALEEASQPAVAAAEPEMQVIVTKVKATTVVNVRSSDSIEADKLGKTTNGQVLDLIEERVNGWSKVNFEGKEGFIKSEFLEVEETQTIMVENPSVEAAEGDTASVEETESGQETTAATAKKATVTSKVRVREEASTEADIITTLSEGTEIEVLEQMSNGWSKVDYQDKVAYIKSDYLEMKE